MKALLLVAALALSGCCSVMYRTAGAPQSWGCPYIGTQAWAQALAYTPDYAPLWFVDFPFEVVTDTALLPVDLVIMPFKEDKR